MNAADRVSPEQWHLPSSCSGTYDSENSKLEHAQFQALSFRQRSVDRQGSHYLRRFAFPSSFSFARVIDIDTEKYHHWQIPSSLQIKHVRYGKRLRSSPS